MTEPAKPKRKRKRFRIRPAVRGRIWQAHVHIPIAEWPAFRALKWPEAREKLANDYLPPKTRPSVVLGARMLAKGKTAICVAVAGREIECHDGH